MSEGSKNGPSESFLAFIIPPVGERNALGKLAAQFLVTAPALSVRAQECAPVGEPNVIKAISFLPEICPQKASFHLSTWSEINQFVTTMFDHPL